MTEQQVAHAEQCLVCRAQRRLPEPADTSPQPEPVFMAKVRFSSSTRNLPAFRKFFEDTLRLHYGNTVEVSWSRNAFEGAEGKPPHCQ